MKNKKLMIIAMLLLSSTFGIKAQNMPVNKPSGKGVLNIPNLTESQKAQIKEMRTENLKEIKPLRNELREKEAHLQTLQTSDNPNINEIYALIDETGALKTQIAKKRAGFRQDVRKILTEEQRVYYDMQLSKSREKNLKRKPVR
ncbi:MAG: Spy/CpxP family protein refolding chaperone [Chlorobi bacterium]|nr:Spy/CpxP family protein refolding chaperone [Chlorobiota bacterium]